MLNYIKNILKLALIFVCFQFLLAEGNSFRIGLQNGISSENIQNLSPKLGIKFFPGDNLSKNISPILSFEYKVIKVKKGKSITFVRFSKVLFWHNLYQNENQTTKTRKNFPEH